MSGIGEALKRVDDTVNKSWLSRIPGNAEFIISDEYGAGHSVTIDDLRTILAALKGINAEIAECNDRIKACAEENAQLKEAIKCLPDYNVYRHEDFVDEYIKWLKVNGDTVGIKLEFIDYVPDNGRTVVRVVQKDNANS